MMLSIVLWFFLAVILVELSNLVLFRFNFKNNEPITSVTDWPSVTILIAARNEEDNLPRYFQALQNVDYPEGKFTVLIGNDQSTDNTQQIIDRWINIHPIFKSIPILSNQSGLIAKANVLTQLADRAKGEYLVILDADIQVSPNWLKSMVAQAVKGYDVVSGYTEVQAKGFFSNVQRMDWQNSIHTLKVFSDIGYPLSALGNNMLISKKVYDALGGFRALGPTKVEDLKLTKIIAKKGHSFFQLIDCHKAHTNAVSSFSEYILQRKRWLSGVIKYRPLASIGFMLLRMMLVALVAMAFLVTSVFQWFMLVFLVGLKLLVEHFKQRQIINRLGEEAVKFSFAKPVVIAVLDTFAFITLILKPRIEWKKRKY